MVWGMAGIRILDSRVAAGAAAVLRMQQAAAVERAEEVV
jgi:hypothetical protein